MGPLGYLGVPQLVACLPKQDLAVIGLGALVPDLVHKPPRLLGVTFYGRYAAHTIVFALLVSAAFSLKSRLLGLSALFGGMLHLLLDSGYLVLWFYPFVRHDFPEGRAGVSEYLHRVLTLSCRSSDLI
jgi:hypothetical protein